MTYAERLEQFNRASHSDPLREMQYDPKLDRMLIAAVAEMNMTPGTETEAGQAMALHRILTRRGLSIVSTPLAQAEGRDHV